MDNLIIPLRDMNDTIRLAKAFAKAALEGKLGIVLLKGGLGAGKTTLVRHFIASLPGAEKAEVSSPSFTILNIYNTAPIVWHLDLYRLDPYYPDESLDEALDDTGKITIIEWSERLPEDEIPEDCLSCFIQPCARGSDSEKEKKSVGALSLSEEFSEEFSEEKGSARLIELKARGSKSRSALKTIMLNMS